MIMSWFDRMRVHSNSSSEKKWTPKTFPTASTLFGIALALIVLWLLAVGLPNRLGTTDPSVSRNTFEAGASK